MSTLSHVSTVPPMTAIRRFVLHFLEMCVVMCAGGGVVAVAIFGTAGALGYPDLVARAPELTMIIIAIDLAAVMAAYMALRGHAVRHNVEMSGSTAVGGVLFVVAYALGFMPAEVLARWDRLFVFMCGPLCVLMLAVMAVRFEHYGGQIGRARVAASAGDYTCPMHPEVRRAEAGRCPLCDMTLTRRSM